MLLVEFHHEYSTFSVFSSSSCISYTDTSFLKGIYPHSYSRIIQVFKGNHRVTVLNHQDLSDHRRHVSQMQIWRAKSVERQFYRCHSLTSQIQMLNISRRKMSYSQKYDEHGSRDLFINCVPNTLSWFASHQCMADVPEKRVNRYSVGTRDQTVSSFEKEPSIH